jgi:hypothetical protein
VNPMFAQSAEAMAADLLLDDIARLLPQLHKQAAPARGPESAGFDHASTQRRTT